ncbi:MAG: glycerophosphodiester phosphodiesterase family protein [Halioglobus sp.]
MKILQLPRCISLPICAVLFSTTTAALADIKVQGHRGARAERPENTLAAFQYALDVGVDVLELDLGVSKDDVLVISHDPIINNFCLRDGKPPAQAIPLRSQTLSQLKELDCGSVKNPDFPNQVLQPGEPMATLEELFQMLERSDTKISKEVTFNIETKLLPIRSELTPSAEHFARLLVDEIQEHKLQRRVVVQSFDYRTLKWVKKLDPSIATSQLTIRNFVDLVAAAKSIDAQYISPDWKSITKEMVSEFQANDLRVAPWTANTVEAWDALIEMGVDEIITDDPAALISYLQRKGLRP